MLIREKMLIAVKGVDPLKSVETCFGSKQAILHNKMHSKSQLYFTLS